jgi:hypothetical protein
MTTSVTSTIESYHNQIEKGFGKKADATAKEKGFVQRQSPITGSLFLHALVWTVFRYGHVKLPRLVTVAEELEPDCVVSEQAFDQRFTEAAAAFLQVMFAGLLQQTIPQAAQVVPLLSAFSAVYLMDSSTVPLPESLQLELAGCGGSGPAAAAKVYLVLDWLRGSYEDVQVRAGRQADQVMGAPLLTDKKPGALWLFDLGFWNTAYLAALAVSSYFLARRQSQTIVYVTDAQGQRVRLDLDRLLARAPRDRAFELAVAVGAREQVPCRLVCVPVPASVANARRRRVRADARRRGQTPSQQRLRRCDWTLLVTNARAEQLPTTSVATVYRVRWQVELAFKLAKSDAGLERTYSGKGHRVLCEFYAKLIALLLFQRLMALVPMARAQRLSYPKAWRRLADQVLVWGRRLRQGAGRAELERILPVLARRARPSKKRKYPSTVQHVEQAARTASQCCLVDPLGFLQRGRRGNAVQVAHFFKSSPASVSLAEA